MANTEELLELATIAKEAIDEAARIQKTAAIGDSEIVDIADALVENGLLGNTEKEAFIKTASHNPKTLVGAFKWVAKKASCNIVASTFDPVGTIVKANDQETVDRDQPYLDLYKSRNSY